MPSLLQLTRVPVQRIERTVTISRDLDLLHLQAEGSGVHTLLLLLQRHIGDCVDLQTNK
jgi:hypothetical protein